MAKGDSKFEKHFLWLVSHDTEFLQRYHKLIAPETYEIPEHAWFLRECVNYFLDYGGPITAEAIDLILERKKANPSFDKDIARDLYDEAEEPDEESIPFLVDHAEDFLRRRQTEIVIQDFADAIEDGDFDTVRSILAKGLERLSLTTGGDPAFTVTQNWKEAFQRVVDRYADDGTAVKTGIDPVDSIMLGGLRGGELGVYMAPPGHGKSQWLIHISREAYLEKKTVIYFSFEMSEEQVIQRFTASMLNEQSTHIPYLDPAALAVRMEKIVTKKKLTAEFIVKRYPQKSATAADLMAVIQEYEAAGTHIDMVVVDYGDIMAPMSKGKDRKEDQAAVYGELRGMAVALDIPVWTASQTNRLAMRKKVVTIEHLADAWDKAMIADYIIAQCQTEEEKRAGEMRFWFAKCRNNAQGNQILVDLDFGFSTFKEKATGSVAKLNEEDDKAA